MSDFALSVEDLAPGAVSVRLRGDLDHEHAYVFDEELRSLETRQSASALVVDLRELAFIDSSGVAALMAARRRAARAARKIVLIEGGPVIRRILRLAGLADAFEIVAEMPTELARMSARRLAVAQEPAV